VDDNWNQQREGIALVCFQNVQEIVVLEKAHGAICNLKMKARNAFNQSLKDLRNVGL
jgi:hypothetical protein